MQDERSQLQNKARAMRCCAPGCCSWRRRSTTRRCRSSGASQVGGGGRGEKIRTYNYKENRLTDHRIGFTIYRLQDVLAGDLTTSSTR